MLGALDGVARLLADCFPDEIDGGGITKEVLAVDAVAEETVRLVEQVDAQLVVGQMVLAIQQVTEG